MQDKEDCIMLLGYCCKSQRKLEPSQGCSTVCTIPLPSLQVGEIRRADHSILRQHSVNFPLGSPRWAQEATLVRRCCAGRRQRLGSSRETGHACVVRRGGKHMRYVLENMREGERATKGGSSRKSVLGSNLTLAYQGPNRHDIARRWASFLVSLFIGCSSSKPECLCESV